MHATLRFVMLLSAVCAVFCYRAPVSGSGSYTLPNIGKYPAPQPTFPRNHGLPDVYKHMRHYRSVDDQLYPVEDQQLIKEPAFEGLLDEVYRTPRSAEEYLEEKQVFVDEQAELVRVPRKAEPGKIADKIDYYSRQGAKVLGG